MYRRSPLTHTSVHCATNSYADSLESGLEAEVENGRVARMLIKLGFINERPEYVPSLLESSFRGANPATSQIPAGSKMVGNWGPVSLDSIFTSCLTD